MCSRLSDFILAKHTFIGTNSLLYFFLHRHFHICHLAMLTKVLHIVLIPLSSFINPKNKISLVRTKCGRILTIISVISCYILFRSTYCEIICSKSSSIVRHIIHMPFDSLITFSFFSTLTWLKNNFHVNSLGLRGVNLSQKIAENIFSAENCVFINF